MTRKGMDFRWGPEQHAAFETLRRKLCETPVLILLEGVKDLWYFVMRPSPPWGQFLCSEGGLLLMLLGN